MRLKNALEEIAGALLHKYLALSKAQAETWRAQQAAPLQCATYATKPIAGKPP